MLLDIDICYDKVEIEGVPVSKPAHISTLDWMDFWSHARDFDTEDMELAVELETAKNEIEDLRHQVEQLQIALDEARVEND